MYCEYFGLQEKPFSLAPASRLLYLSRQHWEAIAHLLYGVEDDWGFVLLTGEIGTGKTTICRFLLEQLPENVEVALIINPKLTAEELLATICDEFRIPYPEGNKSIKVFVDKINAFLLDVHSKACKALLIIDEAQCLSAEVLDQLRLLTNLETDQSKLLRIILIGQPELRDKLSKPELVQMAQRITARYHIGPLSKKETAEYVDHRLKAAGCQGNLFPDSTIKEIHHFSKGIPRLINAICDRALLGACLQKHSFVNKATLSMAAQEVSSDREFIKKNKKTVLQKWGFAVFFIIVVIVLMFVLFNIAEGRNTKLYDTLIALRQEEK
jgi:general secretion pathway protein A